MATISTSLQLYDRMSGVLSGIIRSINQTASAMSGLQASMNSGFNPAPINQTLAAIQQTAEALKPLPELLASAQTQQNKLTQAAQDGEKKSKGFLSSIGSLVTNAFSTENMKKLGQATIGGAMEQQKLLDMFIARTGDVQIGTSMFETVKADALAAGQDVAQSLQGTLGFFSATQDAGQVTKLNSFAQRLSAFDGAGKGIEGASSALKEALGGDVGSLAEQFNLSEADMEAFGIDQLGKAGIIDGFLTAFDQLLEKQGMGQQAFEEMMKSPAKQMEVLQNNVTSEFADAGKAALGALLPAMVALNEAFSSGKFDPFFDALSVGLEYAAKAVAWLVTGALWLSEVISQNWSWIEPVIWGIAAALATYALGMGIAYLVTNRAAAAQALLNAVMNLNPILLIVSLIAGLIVWLVRLWQTNDQFASALYQVWNNILGFFDQVPIFFFEVGMGVVNAFQEMKVKSLQIVDLLINGVLEGINWLIDKLNQIPGVSIKALDGVDFASKAAAEAEAIRQAGEKALAQMKDQAAEKARKRQQALLDFDKSRAAKRAEEEEQKGRDLLGWYPRGRTGPKGVDGLNGTDGPAGPAGLNIDSIDRVGEVGHIRDTVDISAEDLRIMRELAEMRNIQNFVTLQPQLTFGDTHIKQSGRSVDEIVASIKEKLHNEIASSARAVLA